MTKDSHVQHFSQSWSARNHGGTHLNFCLLKGAAFCNFACGLYTCVSNAAQKLEKTSFKNKVDIAIDRGLKADAGTCAVFLDAACYLHLFLHFQLKLTKS